MRTTNIANISKLSLPEKILLVEGLWDEIAAESSDMPVPESHIKELNRRLKKYDELVPGKLLTLEELQARVD